MFLKLDQLTKYTLDKLKIKPTSEEHMIESLDFDVYRQF